MSEFKTGDLVRVTSVDDWDVGIIDVGDVLNVSEVDSDGDIYYFKNNQRWCIYPDQVELVESKNQVIVIDSQVSYVLSNLPIGELLELDYCYNATTEQEVVKEFDAGCKGGCIELGDKYMVYKLVHYKVLEIGTKETLV